MKIQLHRSSLAEQRAVLAAACALFFASTTLTGTCQRGITNQVPNQPITIPNRSLSPDELKVLDDKILQRRNFSAANAARKLQIDDEANKLLILARDLKSKTDTMGSHPPSLLMVREAAMIEVLANDVKEKMKLTVNPNLGP